MSDTRIRYIIIEGNTSQDRLNEIRNSDMIFNNLIRDLFLNVIPNTIVNFTPNTTVLSKDELNNISEKKYSEISTEENTCSICIDIIKQDDIIRQLNCKHVFHTKCIEKYLLEYNSSCPLCREKLK